MKRWTFVLVIIGALFLGSYLIAGILGVILGSDDLPMRGNVALIPLEGIILTSGARSYLGDTIASSSTIVDFIEKANNNPRIKAILFEINSPGGSGVASDEIAQAVKLTNKTTVSYIREVGASGAYWVASATDYIFVNRMSLTGSIGVIASYLEFSGLLSDYNISYERLVAGKYKDMGSPLRKLTPTEREKLQGQLDTVHTFFIQEVAQNRNLSEKAVRKLATGEAILGITAVQDGLADSIGGKREAVKYIETELNITAEIAEYKKKKTLLDVISEVFSNAFYKVGMGIGSSISTQRPTVWT